MINMKQGLLGMAAAAFLVVPAQAQTMMQDENPIVLSGTVSEVMDNEFTLQYNGNNTIKVELGDQNWFGEDTNPLTIGDKVVVSGEVSDKLFDDRQIEAASIYLVTDSAYYTRTSETVFPSYLYGSANNQDLASQLAMQEPAAGGDADQTMTKQEKSWISAVGTINTVEGNEVTIDAGEFDLTVNISDLQQSPQNLAEGDRIFVSGALNQDFLDNQEVSANRLVKISQHDARAQQLDQQHSPSMMQQDQQEPILNEFPG